MAQETWWQWIWRILWIPIAFFTGIDYQPNQLADEGTVRGIEFEKYYEKKYGENHVPMFKGSFDEAKKDCKRRNALLVACFVSSVHEDHELFMREALANTRLINFLIEEEENVILWVADTIEVSILALARQLQVEKLPALLMIAHIDGRTIVLRKLEGFAHGEFLMDQIDEMLDILVGHRLLTEQGRKRQSSSTGLRQEQDLAYLRSLEADAQKARERKAAERAEREQKAKEEAERRTKEAIRERRLRELDLIRERLKSEYSGGDAVRLSLQLPNGQRFVRKFAPDDSMDLLYDWAFSLVGEDPNLEKTSFVVRTLLPPKTFELCPKKRLQEVGIQNNIKLIIELI